MISDENKFYLSELRRGLNEGKKILPLFNLAKDSDDWYILNGFILKVESIPEPVKRKDLYLVYLKDKDGKIFDTKLYLGGRSKLKTGNIIKTYGGIVGGKLRTPIGFSLCPQKAYKEIELSSLTNYNETQYKNLINKYKDIAVRNKVLEGRISHLYFGENYELYEP